MKGALPRTIMRAVAAIMIFAAVCVAVFAALSLFGGSIFSASSDQGQTDTPESTSSWSVAQASLVVTAEEQEVAEAEAAGDAVRVIEGQDGGDVAAGQVLLTIDEAVSQEDLIQALCGAGVEAYDAQAVSTSLGDGNVLVLVEYEGDQSPEDACERAASLQFVSYAEANHALELADVQQAATSDDAYLDRQWEHDSIGLSAAWDLSKAEGKVSVAVIDSGVDYDHPDLESNLLLDYAKDTHTNTVGKAAVNDASGHGTHVCGIISAVANNAIGVAGASYNANILPIDASSKDSSGSTRLLISDIVKAIDYVISLKEDPASPDSLKAIRVVNMSFGGDESDNTKAFSDAIQRAQDAGLLVVAAAGNTGNKGNDAMYPAAYDGVIGVGALYSTGSSVAWASYSYHGSCVDISAPGSSIYSTALNGGYSYLSGTSMACPVVSSVAALAFAANSELDADDVFNILVETAMDLGDVGRDEYYGAGEVKADAAVAKALAAAEGDAGGSDSSGDASQDGDDAPSTGPSSGDQEGSRGDGDSEEDPSLGEDRIKRLGGANALGTMELIVGAGWSEDSCESAVLATSKGYWDALSASGLAGLLDCPVLLTAPDSLSSQTEQIIRSLGVGKVYVVGGEDAVSSDVETSVEGIVGSDNVVRLAGEDARKTAQKVYEAGKDIGQGWGDGCIVATSCSFHDALAAAPYSYAKAAPIFLASPYTLTLEKDTLADIEEGSFSSVLICGGQEALSDEVELQLLDVDPGIQTTRKGGATAVETSSFVAQWCVDVQGMTSAHVGVATAADFYDALTGAALCGRLDSPLVLVRDGRETSINGPVYEDGADVGGFISNCSEDVEQALVFGGESAVSADTYRLLAETLGG